ncbi:MAG: hypothetical protein DI556_19340 [Rhodovulum sulfidophilum]|uniref:Glutamine amidotransferase type-2 domain-containing protein n=1 Tax=Rhodovulum sulfidophilum TaxID=35806 RepID=A0A2W5N7R9_RHOSU|nr:MAG: hypothetical protein DI556_19340 [Rhodovulum sulfidophilum]
MCVIITLAPGASINKDQLFNAVYNNWHGFGLLLKDGNNRLELIKEFDPDGTNPERVWKLLEDNKDCYRYLHVRHSTKGATDETNVQPFEIYNSSSRQVYFMHNGTLTGFGGTTSYGQTPSGKSDTAEFCEKILAPALLRWSGENGKADYNDELFVKLVVEKQWTYSSTGLFVSNDMEMRRIGNGWSQYKHPDESSEGEVWTSNTSYYDRVQRGPMFQKIEAAKRAAEQAAKEAAQQEAAKDKKEVSNRGSSALYDDLNDEIPFSGGTSYNPMGFTMGAGGVKEWSQSNCNKSAKVLNAVRDVINRWDLDDPDNLANLRNVTYDEWLAIVDDENEFTIAALLEHLSDEFYKLHLTHRVLVHKNKKAENRIKEFRTGKSNNDESVAA